MILDTVKNAQVAEGVRAQLDLHLDRIRRELGFELVFVARVAGGERRIEAMSADHNFRTEAEVGQVCAAVHCPVVRAAARAAPQSFAGQLGPWVQGGGVAGACGVPVCLSNGTVFGVLGGFAAEEAVAGESLSDAAQSMAVALDLMHDYDIARQRVRGRLSEIIHCRPFYPVFQPVRDLRDGGVIFREGLTRLDPEVDATVPQLLAAAHAVDMGAELELAFARGILEAAGPWPDNAGVAVNLSETTLVSEAFAQFLCTVAPGVTIELTEYAPIRDYAHMARVVDRMRAAGLSLAIDDAGAGYTSLRHILDLKPDILKMDASLSARVDTDPEALALFRFLQSYCDETGTALVIEGIERADQLDALQAIGVRYVQGYHVGGPERLVVGG